jgi:predicted dehydrogenase
MGNHYKIAILGLGSIGTRHFRNIVKVLLGNGDTFTIDLIRNKENKKIADDLASFVNEIYYSYEEVPSDYDVIFITNPTNLHFEAIKQFAPKANHLFIEKPVFDDANIAIDELPLKKDSIYYVACPLRYTNVIQYLKKSISLDKVYCARVICSSFLPDWRPNIDYRTIYSASKEQGGGVSIDLIHELDYIFYLFGYPEKIFNIRGQFSDLEIDSDDLSLYIGKYKNLAIEVHLDYFGRENIREIQLFTADDTIVGDLINGEIRYLKNGKTIKFQESRNDFQQREIEHFFNILLGREKNNNNISTALRTLKLAKEGIL